MIPAEELRKSLGAFRPAHAAEAESHRRICALVESAARPFSRDHYEPGHITASAFVVDRRNRGTVLLHHLKLGIWVQPGGHLEPGDASPAEAALREAREETGLSSVAFAPGTAQPFDLDVHDIPARKNEPAHAHHDLRYLLAADFGEAPKPPDGEAERVRWFTWDEAFALDLDPNLRLGLEKARKAMAAAAAEPEDTIWAKLMFLPILLGSLAIGYFGYHHVYLPRVAASQAGSDVFHAGDRGGLVPECTGEGIYAGLKAQAEQGEPVAPLERGEPLQVIRNHPGASDWFQVRTRDGRSGFVHAACVFPDAASACTGPTGAPDPACWARTGLPMPR